MKGLKPKNIGHTNFYECCDLTEKVYLMPWPFQSPKGRLGIKAKDYGLIHLLPSYQIFYDLMDDSSVYFRAMKSSAWLYHNFDYVKRYQAFYIIVYIKYFLYLLNFHSILCIFFPFCNYVIQLWYNLVMHKKSHNGF